MSQSAESNFVYVTFIRTTPEKLWSALTDGNQMKAYWFGMQLKTEWRTGAEWQLVFPDGRVADAGEILELEPPKRFRLKWRHELRPELKAEGFAICTFEIEPYGDAVPSAVTATRLTSSSNGTALSRVWHSTGLLSSGTGPILSRGDLLLAPSICASEPCAVSPMRPPTADC